MNPEKLEHKADQAQYMVPQIPGFQDEKLIGSLNDLTIPEGKGYLIIKREREM
jgi:hypothetical protein